MSIISDFKGLLALQKIKRGEKARLSISQITNLIINLGDGKRNLPREQFNDVHNLYKKMRECNTKFLMGTDEYLNMAIGIIKQFDEIAPYEKYSGGNELEYSIFMQNVREESLSNKNIQEELIDLIKKNNAENNDFINLIMESGYDISFDNAQAFLGIWVLFKIEGKKEALNKFDLLIESWIDSDNSDIYYLVPQISFLCGLLFSSGIVSEEESEIISSKNLEKITKKRMERNSSDFKQ